MLNTHGLSCSKSLNFEIQYGNLIAAAHFSVDIRHIKKIVIQYIDVSTTFQLFKSISQECCLVNTDIQLVTVQRALMNWKNSAIHVMKKPIIWNGSAEGKRSLMVTVVRNCCTIRIFIRTLWDWRSTILSVFS